MAETRITNKELQAQVQNLNARLGKMVDDFYVLKEDIGQFKAAVADDMRKVLKLTNKK